MSQREQRNDVGTTEKKGQGNVNETEENFVLKTGTSKDEPRQ